MVKLPTSKIEKKFSFSNDLDLEESYDRMMRSANTTMETYRNLSRQEYERIFCDSDHIDSIYYFRFLIFASNATSIFFFKAEIILVSTLFYFVFHPCIC